MSNSDIPSEQITRDEVIRRYSKRAPLVGLDLSNLDLSGVNLTSANLTRANLTRADLDGAKLRYANLTRAKLRYANLTGANLEGADLTRGSFFGANLTRANLTRANLDDADLTGANLTGANLNQAYLRYANLIGADLTGADLFRANLSGANLSGANLTRANLTRADLFRANLNEANLTGAILTGAILTRANLTGANLTNVIREPLAPTAPTDVAYEIHNAFGKINIDKYFEIIKQEIDQDDNKSYDNVIKYVQDEFTNFINQHFTKDKPNSIKKLNKILEKLSGSERKKSDNELIGKSVDFVMKQSKEFIDFYIRAFIQDCYHAYSVEDGLSCVKGIIERFVFIVGDAAFAMCPDDCDNETYTDLKKLFGKNKADKNELTQQWADTYLYSDENKHILENMSKEQRKEHYINFMENEYKKRELLSDENKQIIQDEADKFDYVFESLQFGGKSKKTSKKPAKKTSKKTAKKTSKKTAKKTAKKTSKKTSKKTAKKTSKKSRT